MFQPAFHPSSPSTLDAKAAFAELASLPLFLEIDSEDEVPTLVNLPSGMRIILDEETGPGTPSELHVSYAGWRDYVMSLNTPEALQRFVTAMKAVSRQYFPV